MTILFVVVVAFQVFINQVLWELREGLSSAILVKLHQFPVSVLIYLPPVVSDELDMPPKKFLRTIILHKLVYTLAI
jgi:hypothetical protein